MDERTERLRAILSAMARGEDVWKDFLDLLGPFICHILKEDYAFYHEYDEHTRIEILEDIYLRVARYSGARYIRRLSYEEYRGYLRKIIRTVMLNRKRSASALIKTISLEEALCTNACASLGGDSDPQHTVANSLHAKLVINATRRAIENVCRVAQVDSVTSLILRRRIIENAPYSEIAQEVGKNIDAVRHVVHYYRGRVIDHTRQILGLKGKGGG